MESANPVRASPFWKGVLKARFAFHGSISYSLGNGKWLRFWKDIWIGDLPLYKQFPNLFRLTLNEDATVARMFRQECWRIPGASNDSRNVLNERAELLQMLDNKCPNEELDKVHWR